MDLSDPSTESATRFVKQIIVGDASKVNNLCYRLPTLEIYAIYRRWATRHTIVPPISIEDFWGVIQLLFPFTTIIGEKGNRAYTRHLAPNRKMKAPPKECIVIYPAESEADAFEAEIALWIRKLIWILKHIR